MKRKPEDVKKRKRKKAAMLLLLSVFLAAQFGRGLTAAAAGVGDVLVGPEKKAGEEGRMENGSAEEDRRESEPTDGSGQEEDRAEGESAVDGDAPASDFEKMVGTADLDALWDFIRNRETAFREKQSQKMAEAGIPVENQSFLCGDGFEDQSRQILAMTAVCREYTFYNRIVCQWYADHLWDETYTYQVIGTKYQEKAVGQLAPLCGAAADFMGISGASLADAVERTQHALEGKCRVAVVMENRPREEIYDVDHYGFPIPTEWEGWTQEKRAECDALMELDDASFRAELERLQEESLLPSPVPFYKQGAAEWGGESFGGGTLASDACCPTAIAMVVSYFKGERITPLEVSGRYDQDAYRSREQGSYGGKMCAAAAADYGLLVEADTAPLSEEQILGALRSGAKIVMSMKPGGSGGRYATVYHYVTLAGLTEDGRVIVNNPGISTNVTYDEIGTILDNQSGRGYGIFRAG